VPRFVEDRFFVTCPYCGETVEIYVEPDLEGALIQDCEVCCNPWRVVVSDDGDERAVFVSRADGSE
jgi:Cysteine-rich CPXCG